MTNSILYVLNFMSRSQRVLFSLLSVSLVLFCLVWWKLTPPTLADTTFNELPGWQNADLSASFEALQNSCKTFLKQPKEREVGTKTLPLRVNDWVALCQAAKEGSPKNNQAAKQFFEKWFKPVYFKKRQAVKGLFTGYYLPRLHGSWEKTERYRYPIYGKPSDLVTVKLADFDAKYGNKKLTGRLDGSQVIPYHTRAMINAGKGDASLQAIMWVDDRVDRFFLEIQGSGYVDMTDGKTLMLGYAAQNGQPYTPVGRYLIAQGIMNKQNASMQKIRQYLNQHPEKMDEILNQNASYVFFSILKRGQALGGQGVPLTAGYSMAIDKEYIPYGVPIWLSTTYPSKEKGHGSLKQSKLQRLMIAQDTGGAIKGRVRGDVFWGGGQQASFIAGHMKNTGQFWILVPKK